jgi:energy-coupling factor transport system permease protein
MHGETFGYRPLASPLHVARAWIGALWASALIAAVLILASPLVLGTLILAVLAAGAGAGVGRQLARSLRTIAVVVVPIVVINVLVSRDGLTVFARLGDLGPFGQGDLTVEALVYGGWVAMKVALVMLVTTLAWLAIDPDELMRIVRAFSFRAALTASLALRMIPLLAADASRLAEAQRTRPEGPGGVRARVLLLGAVVAGSLDRAMDVAATLEVRGLAAGPARIPRGGVRRGPRRGGRARSRGRGPLFGRLPARPLATYSRHDLAFVASALGVLALAIAAGPLAVDEFGAYPLVHAPVSAGTAVLCLAVAAAVVLPFFDRRGIER